MKYCINELQQAIKLMSDIFQIVRLVNPVERKIVSFDSDQNLIFEQYECYQVWNKNSRCENCISLQACYNDQLTTKFEFVDEEIYQVISQPVKFEMGNGNQYSCVLEMVSKITDRVLFEAFGKSELIDKIAAYQKKVYQDSLTEGFNRRYFDERVFCHNNRCELSGKVVFIMIDLKKFKTINDVYGHAVGDWTLTQTVKAIKSCLSNEDSVIRMGGDEFLVVLYNSTLEAAEKVIAAIKEAMKKQVVYDQEKNQYVVANFGVSFTSDFQDVPKLISDMLEEADRNMYIDKNLN